MRVRAQIHHSLLSFSLLLYLPSLLHLSPFPPTQFVSHTGFGDTPVKMSPKQKSNPSGHRTTSIKTDTQYSKLFEEYLKTLDPPICSTVNHDSPEDSRSGLQLRDYQNDGVVAVLKATEGGLTRIGVSAPPGAGKTIMFTTLIPMIKPRNNMDAVLIIVPGITLADQAAETLGEHLPDRFKVGIEQGGSRARRGHNM